MTEPAKKSSPLNIALPWLVTISCFSYLYWRISQQSPDGDVIGHMAAIFSKVSWGKWLLLMIPYSFFYFLIDSLVTWRVINWFNTKISYRDVLPIRGSAYILSIINEQVSKGAMALYLNRRNGIPGWQVVSSMLFIMVCELYYLLSWATVGVLRDWDRFPDVFHIIPTIAVIAFIMLIAIQLYMGRSILRGWALRDQPILHSFRHAKLTQYFYIILLRSPALLAAVFVYTHALSLFGVETSFGAMLGYLPVIFFGAATPGPMRSVAVLLWSELFPENRAEMAIFGLVQHNFFIFFNAAIGLIFLRRANRELFGDADADDLRSKPA